MGAADVGHPVAHRLADCFFEGLLAGLHPYHLRPHETHPENVERLALHVDCPHVDRAIQPELGAHRRRGDTMLSGTGLGDHALLAHPSGEQGLAEGVVDFMSPGMEQVLALEIDLSPAAMIGQSFREIQFGRTAGELLQVLS